MRIDKIILKNYRQYKNIEIQLSKKTENDLHIFIGKNGSGKTNLLNSINWCLYGDEPHLSRDSQQLPILNIENTNSLELQKNQEVMAQVWIKSDDNKYMIFTRKADYIINKDNKPVKNNINFEVQINDNKGNMKQYKDDEAKIFVDRFVPERIREFFFFDGERMDKYFKEATGQNIKHEILSISQLDLLDKIINKLEEMSRELTKEAGKTNPDIERIYSNLQNEENNLKSIESQIEECEKQIKIAYDNKKEYEEKTRGLPDIDDLKNKLEYLKSEKKNNNDSLNSKIKEKNELIYRYGILLQLYPAIIKIKQIIEEKKNNKELPPSIDRDLLENILKNKNCLICGNDLNDKSVQNIKNLLDKINMSSEIAYQLTRMENPLNSFLSEIKKFKDEINNKTLDIENYKNNIHKIEEEINEIDYKMIGYNPEQIKDWYDRYRKYEKIYDEHQQNLGVLRSKLASIKKNIEMLNSKLQEELAKESKNKKIRKEIKFCNKALDIAKETKYKIMKDIRDKIELETKEIFFELLWKKKTFKDIKFDDSYNINLIHSSGYECIGTIGAAERELLALSFTLALHKIAGFNSPIIIDTPVARISDEHREKFAKIFLDVSKNKQIILLFTPSEYSEEIYRLLDENDINKYILKLSSDEKETIIEGE